jgi:hypothetical protein
MQKPEHEPVYAQRELFALSAWIQVLNKIPLFMRLTILLLTTAFLQVHANSTAQSVSVTVNNASLKEFFAVIKKQTGYVLLAKESDLQQANKVTISVANMPLRDLLDKVFSSQPLKYGIKGRTIFLSEKPAPVSVKPMVTEVSSSVFEKVTGRVTDAAGQVLQGVNVYLKGTFNGASTDANGRFSIDVPEDGVLEFSYIGFETQTFSVKNAGFISLVMKKSENKLDEVQIIAYGQTSGRLSTSNISSVKSKDIERVPVNNPLLAVAGRVPGVFITQTTGFSGSGVQVQIQGRISISSGTTPF